MEHYIIHKDYLDYGMEEIGHEKIGFFHNKKTAIEFMINKAKELDYIFKVYNVLDNGENGELLAIWKNRNCPDKKIYLEKIESND